MKTSTLQTPFVALRPNTYTTILLVVLGAVTLLKLYLAIYTQGSIDVAAFADHLEKIRALGVGAYRVRGAFDNPFNHPPPMIHVFRLWGWLTDHAGLSFGFWLRLPSIIADIGSFFLVRRWLKDLNRYDMWALLAMILCPTAILISGYHGNTDSVMIFLLLLSLYLAERTHWLAGVVFGLALCVKVVPLAFAPLLFFYLPWRKAILFFALAGITFGLLSLPYIAQDPQAVWSTVFGYSSIYGKWGFTAIATLTFPDLPTYAHGVYDVQGAHAVFAKILKLILVITIVAVSAWMNHRRVSLYIQCGVVTAILLFMVPGFGSQYLVWLVPSVPVLGFRRALPYLAASGVYCLVYYSCVGLGPCLQPGTKVLLALTCWLSVLVTILHYRRLSSISYAQVITNQTDVIPLEAQLS